MPTRRMTPMEVKRILFSEYFTKYHILKKASCKFCHTRLPTRNLSNLVAHLKNEHNILFSQFKNSVENARRMNYNEIVSRINKNDRIIQNEEYSNIAASASVSTTHPSLLPELTNVDVIETPAMPSLVPKRMLVDMPEPPTNPTIPQHEKYADFPTNKSAVLYFSTDVIEPPTNSSQLPKLKHTDTLELEKSFITYYPANTTANSINIDRRAIDENLLKALITNYLSLNTIEEPSFVQLAAVFNCMYKVPSEVGMSANVIPSIYSKALHNQKKKLMKDATHVSLSIECWTSKSSQQFIGITAHYINKTFKLESVLLKTLHFSDIKAEPRGKEISEEIDKVLTDWCLLGKVKFVTTENVSILREASAFLGHRAFTCYASELNRIAVESIKVFEEITRNVKQIVHHFLRSHEAAELLLEHQKQIEGKSKPKRLLNSNNTQWKSIYDMLKRFSELECAIKTNMPCVEPKLPELTEEYWVAIREICQVLQPLVQVQNLIIDGECYINASMAIVITNRLTSEFQTLKHRKYSVITVKLLNTLLQSISKCFSELEANETLAICTYLDPRFKEYAFSDKWAVEITRRRILELTQHCTSAIHDEEPISENDESNGIQDNYLKTAPKIRLTRVAIDVAEKELEKFVKSPFLAKEECPREWWRRYQKMWPNLAQVYKRQCHAVVSSVPVRRLFTEEGQLLMERRARLSHHQVEQFAYLNSPFKMEL